MSSDLSFYTSSDDEYEVNSELNVFAEACQAAYEASKPKNPSNPSRKGSLRIDEVYFCNSSSAYRCVPDSLDEYLQMGATTARSIDCTDWPWENFPVAFKAQFCRGDHGPDPFILLEALASNDLWIYHAFFSVSGMNNDVNVLRQSPIFNQGEHRMFHSWLTTCLIKEDIILLRDISAIVPGGGGVEMVTGWLSHDGKGDTAAACQHGSGEDGVAIAVVKWGRMGGVWRRVL
nr:protein ALP1-like [Tanacetum cinerariifolium]